MVINDDMTHLLVIATRKQSAQSSEVSINTGNVIVKPLPTEHFLRMNIHQSLKWKEHIISNGKSMLKMLRTRLNALIKISENANFMTRLMVANACFLSIITSSPT